MPFIFNNFDKGIYCTYEGIFHDDISKLYDINLENKSLGAAKDISYIAKIKTHPFRESECFSYLKMKNPYNFIQDGLLIFNIPELIKQNLFYKTLLALRSKCNTPQKLINTIYDNNIVFIDGSWNFEISNNALQPNYERILSKQTYEEYLEASKDIKFSHFIGECKPWKTKTKTHVKEYYKIAKETPFKDVLINTKTQDKTHKIIKIFGITLKFKRKQK